MGLWSGIKAFSGYIFGNDKVADNVLDKDNGLLTQVGNWVGNMNFTAEEQAEFNKGMSEGVQKFAVDTLSENTVRSKTRRDISKLWIKTQLGLVLMCAICIPFDEHIAKQYFELATSPLMMLGTSAVIAFFYGTYYAMQRGKSK